jgi:hypothetical protein
VIITDGEGNVRVLKLSEVGDGEADVRTSDGEGRVEVRSKAIVVGPDGKHEVILNEDGAKQAYWSLQLAGEEDGRTAVWQIAPEGVTEDVLVQAIGQSGYMIGVSCQPASEALRAQLGIDFGLVVDSVVEDSPSTGLIEQYDLLLRAGDSDLTDVPVLVEAVKAAGEGEKELEIVLLRRGEKQSVSVTPKKRDGEFGALLKTDVQLEPLRGMLRSQLAEGVTLESFGPGVIRMKQDAGDLQAQIEKLRAEVEELRKQLKK